MMRRTAFAWTGISSSVELLLIQIPSTRLKMQGAVAGAGRVAASGTASKTTRKSTSDVRNDYEKLFKTVNNKKIRYAAQCL